MPSLYRSRSVVAVSDSTAWALVSLGMPAANITVVHNGVDVADIGERTVSRADEPTFLAVGRLVPHKRFDLLLRAWAKVQPITGGRLLLAGEGPLRDELAADLPPSTELLGRVTDEERRSLMEAAWFLVQPSRLEGWGLVVMEAAAASTPTLGFWAPGTSDAVVHGESGILVHTEAELVEEWVRLAQDPLARQMLSKGAEERARHFSWERSITDFEAVLRRAADGAGAGMARSTLVRPNHRWRSGHRGESPWPGERSVACGDRWATTPRSCRSCSAPADPGPGDASRPRPSSSSRGSRHQAARSPISRCCMPTAAHPSRARSTPRRS